MTSAGRQIFFSAQFGMMPGRDGSPLKSRGTISFISRNATFFLLPNCCVEGGTVWPSFPSRATLGRWRLTNLQNSFCNCQEIAMITELIDKIVPTSAEFPGLYGAAGCVDAAALAGIYAKDNRRNRRLALVRKAPKCSELGANDACGSRVLLMKQAKRWRELRPLSLSISA